MKRNIASKIGLLALGFLLSSCASTDINPPTVTITSPAANAPVSSTAVVQVSASDNDGVARVDLYARGKGMTDRGVRVGSATQEPYVISWYTPSQPNFAELELIAVAVDSGNNEGESQPVAVKVQNSGVPALQLLTAYTLPPDASLSSASLEHSSLNLVQAQDVLPPANFSPTNDNKSMTLTTQATAERQYVLEWQWQPFDLGAEGYGVYLSDKDVAGPYEAQIKQSASAGAGVQKFSKITEGADAGSSFYGAVTAVINGASAETGYSNADKATFLPAQDVVSPTSKETVSTGRPTLTWTSTAGTVGYLYYVYDRNPWEKGAKLLWSNFPQATSSLSAAYPSDKTALASGTYWWWVAGVSFDSNRKADGFTFSEPRSFIVP
jgi:hypothetical protein